MYLLPLLHIDWLGGGPFRLALINTQIAAVLRIEISEGEPRLNMGNTGVKTRFTYALDLLNYKPNCRKAASNSGR